MCPPSNGRDDQSELDRIAAGLYRLRPDQFVGARDERVRAAREQGDAPLARALARLRRPTQSAWLVNLLWHDRHDEVEGLLSLGDRLRRAQQRMSADELHEITAERRRSEAELVRHAREMAEAEGVSVSADMARAVEETFAAALAEPEVAEEIRSGRLLKPASYSGFGSMLWPLPAEPEAPEEPAPPQPAEPSRPAQERGETRAQRDRRERAEHKVAQARQALEAAEADVTERAHAVDDADERHRQLASRLDELREELSQLQDRVAELTEQVAAAERGLRAERRRMGRAEQTRSDALAKLKREQQAASAVRAD